MLQLLKKNGLFLFLLILWLASGTIALSLFEKGGFLVWLNGRHTPFLDYFFYGATLLGDGWIILGLSLVLAFMKLRYTLLSVACYLISGALAQLFKRIIDIPRPSSFLDNFQSLHQVPGIEISKMHSFPSGHTVSAFAFFCLLAILVRNKGLRILFFILAALTGLSRVYMLQHFLVDVLAGSVLGTATTFVVFYYFNPFLEKRFPRSGLSLPRFLGK